MHAYYSRTETPQARSRQYAARLVLASTAVILTLLASGLAVPLSVVHASGGGKNTTPVVSKPASNKLDVIKVSKAYTNATKTKGGELLLKAASSNSSAHLLAYRPNGTLIGEVQNGGGSKYGGTVMPYQFYDPSTVTIRSSAGGSITVKTTPFQL